MSQFSGTQHKGAARQVRDEKRADATKRQSKFDALVNETATRENLSDVAARQLVNREASAFRGFTHKSI